MMQCDQCKSEIEQGEEREYREQTLCEDCYMDVLSPPKSCDPWAVYAAKSMEKHSKRAPDLNPMQLEILRILEETGGMEKPALLEKLDGKLSLSQLDRELATLRHMERAKAEKKEDKVILRVW